MARWTPGHGTACRSTLAPIAPACNSVSMLLSRRTCIAGLAAVVLPVRLIAAPPTASALGATGMTAITDDLWIKRIDRHTWLFTTTAPIDGGVIYPANGLVHRNGDALTLVDPGWTPAQGQALIAWCERSFGRMSSGAIITHFHADRAAALPVLERAGIPVHMLPLTRALLKGGTHAAQALPAPFAEAVFGLECYYPGAGHSPDNIVLWDADQRLLFGGCFLKDAAADSIGNLADASVPAWRDSLERVAARYPHVRTIIPGHGRIGGDAIGRTRALLAAL